MSAEENRQAIEAIHSAPRIFLAGSGRSALGIRGFAMRLMHLGKTVFVVGETTTPALCAHDLLIIGSGSGRTASLVAAATKAKGLGARILLITADRASPIGQLADWVVEIPAPTPKSPNAKASVRSAQPMGSLFEQSLFLLLDGVVMVLMEMEGKTAEEMFRRHANLE